MIHNSTLSIAIAAYKAHQCDFRELVCQIDPMSRACCKTICNAERESPLAMARLIDGTTERSSTAQNLPCRRRSTKARVWLVSDLSVRSPRWSNVPMNESSMTWHIMDGLESSSCLRRQSIFKTSNPLSKRWGYAQSQPSFE